MNKANNHLKVLYDSQAFDMQRFGGVSRYFTSLLEQFNRFEDIECNLPIGRCDNEYLKNMPAFANKDISRKEFFSKKDFTGKKALLKILDNLNGNSSTGKVKKELIAQNFDLFHPTYFDPYFLKYLFEKPFVLTVHDMIHEKYADSFPNDPLSKNKKRLCNKATKIIAISENTKKDLIDIFQIDPVKIEVIYQGQSFNGLNADEKVRAELPKPYILFVGDRRRYKNFPRFINAFAQLSSEFPDLNVVCTGKPFSLNEINLFKKLVIGEKVHHKFANDHELMRLYKDALFFIFPSEYEGFGIPILESFAAGCPVVLSAASSFPEVAGDAGIYFDPLDIDSMIDSMRQVINSGDLRNELIKKGNLQLNKFSWEKAAKETYSLYQEIVIKR
jgi:glycosyltransferase involved in cell wall biosynthesis